MKNRFFTVLFLPANPSKVKKLILSEFLIKSVSVSVGILFLASAVIFFDYVHVKKKEVDLTSLKEQTKMQNVQIQTFAEKINDMEAELARLRSLDTKIRVLTNTKTEAVNINEQMSLGGQGGPAPETVFIDKETLLKDMMEKLDRLNIEAQTQENKLHELHASLEDQKLIAAATPSIWPAGGYISSGFGIRQSPFGGGNEFHEGIDISAPEGSPVVAAADGIVSLGGLYGEAGKAVIVDHGFGYVTVYGHMSKIVVKVGQKVTRGQKIGEVGNTGRSTGPHLHYMVKVAGSNVNPRKYMN